MTTAILVIAGLFIALKSGLFNSLSSAFGPSFGAGYVAPPLAQSVAPTYTAPSQQSVQAAQQGADQALNLIPVAGPALSAAFNAISGGLVAASRKRAQEATSENSAVAKAVPGWDAAIAQIVAAYNSGAVSGQQATTLLEQAMQNYFNEVSPQIQPGRNGCQSGAYPDQQALQTFASNPQSECSGSWGAACCVGYAALWNGVNNIEFAISTTENTGGPTPAVIPGVFPSKYGGTARPQYTVTVTRPTGGVLAL